MLQQKLNDCRILMQEVSNNKKKDNEYQETVKGNNTFFDSYNNILVPIIEGYVICKRYGHAVFSDSTKELLKEVINYSKQTFEQGTVLNAVRYRNNVKKLDEIIKKEWEECTDNYLSEIKDDLGILKLVSNEKQEIGRILVYLNNFSSWPNETKASQYDESIKKANAILSRMKFDDEIADFLKKVKNKEASLLDLTDTIIDWIRRENLSGNIMLNIKN